MQKVMGQTGSVVLSDETAAMAKSARQTARYRYVKMATMWRAEIIGPFHSRLYGACGIATSRERARARLIRTLANNHGYHGGIMLSDVDESDVVGQSSAEVWHKANNEQRAELGNIGPVPITCA